MSEILESLIQCSHTLGEPERELVILGEGNTSARVDHDEFLVKASGSELRTISEEGFVRVSLPGIVEILDGGELADAEIEKMLRSSVREDNKLAKRRMPSIETMLHAVCLAETEALFVAHTHPISVNGLACSIEFESALKGCIFPDQIIMCGPHPLLVGYYDPGLPLARAVRDDLRHHIKEHGAAPKTIYLQNHGLFALGRSARDVVQITMMADKAARILIAAHAAGGPKFLGRSAIDRIHTRPDEVHRKNDPGTDCSP